MHISLRSLTFAYRFTPGGSATLNNITLDFDSSEAIGLLGQVGTGKSTLLKIIAGALMPGKNMVFVDDADFKPRTLIHPDTGERPWWSRCAYVAQRPEDQLVGRTVEQEIAYALNNLYKQEQEVERVNARYRGNRLRRLSRDAQQAKEAAHRTQVAARVADVLRGAGLDPATFRTRGLDDLSRGEKRRVALAAALALDPDMLLLDESLSNIDPAGHDALIATIQHARSTSGCGMIASSHRIEDILPFVERIVVLTPQGIGWDGPTGRFLEAWAAAWDDPQNAPHAAIFAALNVPPLLETLFRLRAGGLSVPLSAAIATAPDLAATVVSEAMARRKKTLTPDPSPVATGEGSKTKEYGEG